MNFEETIIDYHGKNPGQSATQAFSGLYNIDATDLDLWNKFYPVWSRLETERRSQLHKSQDFLKDLQDLSNKYNVKISSGCGCCGAGAEFAERDDKNRLEIQFQVRPQTT